MKRGLIMAAAVLGSVLSATPYGTPKKAIAHGWDLLWRAPWELRNNVQQIAKLPFDGISMAPHMRQPGQAEASAIHFFRSERFEKAWFNEFISVGKMIAQYKKHNFLATMWAPNTRIAWDDDAAWNRVANNIGVLAYVAKSSGCCGLIMDPEEYSQTHQYMVTATEDYAATAKLARRRGAQIMQSMAKEFPDIVIMSFYLLSNNSGYLKSEIMPAILVERGGSLWPHFINGFLDALPPQAKLIDGCEYGYAAEYDANGFYRLADDIRHRALELVAPENRAKYRNQVQVGFGHYLDAYLRKYGPAPKEPMGKFNATRLFNNIQQGMEVADEYCWYYGEKWHFLNWTGGADKSKCWDTCMPGFYPAIEFFKAPTRHARKWLDAQKQAKTLPDSAVYNSNCQPKQTANKAQKRDWKSGALPAGWSFWQAKSGLGTYGLDTACGFGDKFSLTAKAIGSGCFIADFPVTPGEFYVVEGYCKGGNHPKIGVRWFNKYGWLDSYYDLSILPDVAPVNAENWRRMTGLVVVPPGAVKMVLLLGDNLQKGSQGQVNFDAINAYRLDFSQMK